ncbi:conserved hypothetical protein [Rhodospirillaceae bacterium LM-1]|nr:conserved hypothetical protein [Rhodospirillaceae bacterium LM-1]
MKLEKAILSEIERTEGLGPSKLGLRFDRVVIGLVGRLRAFAEDVVPEGTTVLVAVTAPIRVPAKTTAALKERIGALLAGAARHEKSTIHGNRTTIRIVEHRTRQAPKFLGFVHNPDSDPDRLFDLVVEKMRSPS